MGLQWRWPRCARITSRPHYRRSRRFLGAADQLVFDGDAAILALRLSWHPQLALLLVAVIAAIAGGGEVKAGRELASAIHHAHAREALETTQIHSVAGVLGTSASFR